jgi:hypothetical protein
VSRWLSRSSVVRTVLIALAASVVVATVFVVVAQLVRPVEAGRTESRCADRLASNKSKIDAKGPVAGTAAKTDPSAVLLAAIDAQGKPVQGVTQLKFTFGSDRTERIRRQTFRLPAGTGKSTVQAALINDFADSQNEQVMPSEDSQVAVGFQRTSPRGTVTLVVCIDPDGPGVLHPGSYVGAAAVTTSTGPAATISMQVTAQDPRWWLVLAFAFAGGLAGIVVKLFADSQTAGEKGIRQHVWTARTLVAVAAGLVTAVYSFLTIYADDPTFSADFGTLWRVAAETFAGTLAAKALTDLAGRPAASPSSSPPSASPPAPAPPAS